MLLDLADQVGVDRTNLFLIVDQPSSPALNHQRG
jgi:hypothetical protein